MLQPENEAASPPPPPASASPSVPLLARATPAAVRRRGLAFAVPVLAVCTGAVAPALADALKLFTRERLPGLKVLQAAAYILSLQSMAVLPLGLAAGLLTLLLLRGRDPGIAVARLGRWLLDGMRRQGSRPEAAAAVWAIATGLGLFVLVLFRVNQYFMVGFKNRPLAALTLAFLTPLILGIGLLGGLAVRVPMQSVSILLRRVPGLRVLGGLWGALSVILAGVAGATTALCLSYRPIVRMIDWRPLSYPGLLLGVAVLIALAVFWLHGRRLEQGRRAGPLRQGGLAIWSAVFVVLWVYALQTFGTSPNLRTSVLRNGYGAARSFDLLSWGLDFDGDGYLSFFGGGDCAPFDANVHPGALEIPGNGIDDNCQGGDLSPERMRRPPRRFDSTPLPAKLRGKRFNVLLITLDGLRADHLGAYGYSRPTTPHLDDIAGRGTVFESAVAQAPSTRYSIPSFLTSKYFSQIPRKATVEFPDPVLPEALTMAEVMKEHGYRTGAALSYHVFERNWGLDQGFDYYDFSQANYYLGKGAPSWNAEQSYLLVDVAKRFLDTKSDKPYFLWTHFFEPHPPYVHRVKPKDFGSDIVGLYDGELRFVDEKVGELLNAVRQRPDADRTVIIISADHGREFGEHGMVSHGYDLYSPSLHVPLIVYVPGVAPRRIKNPVALLDLLPTMVAITENRRAFDFEGESLLPQIINGVEPRNDRPIFSEVLVGFHDSHLINSITTGHLKLIYDVTLNTYQLFDHRSDLNERRDIAAAHPVELQRMKTALQSVMERANLPTMEEEIGSNLLRNAPPTPGVRAVNFEDKIEFLGFEVNPPRPRAGAILTVTWYVRALRPIKPDYKFLVQLKGSRGAFFDGKHVPIRGQYPSSRWAPGMVIRDRQYMRLPPEPQEWDVWVGFGVAHEVLRPKPPLPMIFTAVQVGKFATY